MTDSPAEYYTLPRQTISLLIKSDKQPETRDILFHVATQMPAHNKNIIIECIRTGKKNKTKGKLCPSLSLSYKILTNWIRLVILLVILRQRLPGARRKSSPNCKNRQISDPAGWLKWQWQLQVSFILAFYVMKILFVQ